MASSKEYLQFILEQLSGLEEINYRAMMGEYIIYYRDRIVGGIYDDRLLVKPTKSAVSYMANATYELPYEGAKEMLLPCRFVLYCFILLFSRRYYICTILHSTFQQKFISERIQFRAYQSLRHMVVKCF